MIEIFTGLHPIRNQSELDELTKNSLNDHNHHVLAPTHLIRKDGVIVGYVSIAGLPMTFCHFSTEDMQAEDSFAVINTVENILQLNRNCGVVTPVSKDSPFHKVLSHPKVGYKNIANVDLFVKEFK
jgi:hypothetical protein